MHIKTQMAVFATVTVRALFLYWLLDFFPPGSGQEEILQRIWTNPKATPRHLPENAAGF